MTTTAILKLIEFYLKKNLPPDITVHTVKYRMIGDEVQIIPDIPEWQRPQRQQPLGPNTEEEHITLEFIASEGQKILAGYSEKRRVLMIGKEVSE